MGVHSCILIATAIALWLAFATNANADILHLRGYIGVTLIYELILMLICEATVAYYFRLLHESMSENERLLNDATASCIVTRSSGCIRTCSYQASSLLGFNANGGRISDGVRLQDQVAFWSFCIEGTPGALPDPILVTLIHRRSWDSTPIGEFDVRVVQYGTANNDDVRLLFELTGEVRYYSFDCAVRRNLHRTQLGANSVFSDLVDRSESQDAVYCDDERARSEQETCGRSSTAEGLMPLSSGEAMPVISGWMGMEDVPIPRSNNCAPSVSSLAYSYTDTEVSINAHKLPAIWEDQGSSKSGLLAQRVQRCSVETQTPEVP